MTSAAPVTPIFNENAQLLICKRYAHRGEKHPECLRCGIRHEDTDQLLERISLGKQEYIDNLFRPLRFLPNSPTWFNLPCQVCGETEPAGTLSACFKFDVEDSMVSILDVGRKGAMVLKYGGGSAYYVGNLRAKGEPIRTTHGKACGPVAVLRYYHQIAVMVTQAGRRDAAQMAVIDDDHPDVREFIHMKDDDPQGLYSFNISVAASDAFMQDVQNGGQAANGLWQEIIESAWKTGDPGFYFKDAAERGNPTPWLGRLTGPNACGEVPLLDSEACNLGSLVLSSFVGLPDEFEELEQTVRSATRYMDDIVSRNIFPDPSITEAVQKTRKLGIGVMGWADLLALRNIPYDSVEAVSLGKALMGWIQNWAHDESDELAVERGVAPCYEGRSEKGRRNATLTCIAPTGSISFLAGCSAGIEPHYALEWTHTMGDGEETTHRIAVADRINEFKPKVANEISVEWHLKHQAAFQKGTDLAVSKTINLPNSATVEDIDKAYRMAWELGCKGVTVFRDGCRAGGEQVLRDVSSSAQSILPPLYAAAPKVHELENIVFNGNRKHDPTRTRLPATRPSLTHRFQVGEQEGYLTVGLFEDGSPGELFVSVSKNGSTVQGLMDSVGILTSVALQYGVPLRALVKKFRQTKFEPAGFTDNKAIPQATSLLDYVFHFLEHQFLESRTAQALSAIANAPFDQGEKIEWFEGEELKPIAGGSGEVCPECGGVLIHAEGCEKCASCDYNRCG